MKFLCDSAPWGTSLTTKVAAIIVLHSDVIRDCRCGLRYMRHTIADDRVHAGFIACRCGRCLEHWRGAFWLDYEPEERSSALH